MNLWYVWGQYLKHRHANCALEAHLTFGRRGTQRRDGCGWRDEPRTGGSPGHGANYTHSAALPGLALDGVRLVSALAREGGLRDHLVPRRPLWRQERLSPERLRSSPQLHGSNVLVDTPF